ncbi:MAG: hypothetical protein WCK58_10765, partial [Chloroflexota bacterium]
MRLSAGITDYLPFTVAAFLVAAVIALVLTPVVRRVAVLLDNIDHPDDRRVNAHPIPRGGGMAVAVAFLVVAAGGMVLNGQTGDVPVPLTLSLPELLALLGGAIVATVLGVLDDTFQLRARWQFLGQLALAGIALVAGLT